MSYCNAGHNAPLLLRANGDVEPLASTGMVLGIMPHAKYQQEICHLDQGDMLILFSDGVTEACAVDCDEQFGEEKLAAVLRARGEERADELLDAVKAEITSFTEGAAPADDMRRMRRAERPSGGGDAP